MSTGKRTLFLSKAEWFSVVTALGIVLDRCCRLGGRRGGTC